MKIRSREDWDAVYRSVMRSTRDGKSLPNMVRTQRVELQLALLLESSGGSPAQRDVIRDLATRVVRYAIRRRR